MGNVFLQKSYNCTFSSSESSFTISYIAVDGKFLGYAEFSDGIKKEAAEAISELGNIGISTALLSGDKKNAVLTVASVLGIKQVHYELLPQDKVTIIDGGGKSGSGVEAMGGYVPAVLAKTIESIKETTGIDINEIVKADTYDAKVTKNLNVTGIEGQDVNLVVGDSGKEAAVTTE